MNYQLISFISLFLAFNCPAMEKITPQVLAAGTVVCSTHHTTYHGILDDGRRIEIEVCTKLRKTRNASPLELHYSGKIGKHRLTRAQARNWVTQLQEAKQITFVHPAAFKPVKIEKN